MSGIGRRGSVCRCQRYAPRSYSKSGLTHTETHTGKRADKNSGEDRMYLPQYTERKGSKSPEIGQTERPDTLRNQQVMCSSHTTSSKKHRKLRFSMLFCCENAEKGVGQNVGQALTHTVTHKRNKLYPRKWTRDFDPWSRSADTHLTHRGSQRLCRLLPAHAPWVQRNARKDPKSTGEKLLPFRCSACLRDLSNLRHEAAHFLRGLLLHLPCDVGVGSQGESRVVVTEH